MFDNGKLWIAKGEDPLYILPKMANRHGLIAGASGTGKTISLKVLAESFSDCGVPVFLADVKGDLSGMLSPGEETEIIKKRVAEFPIENWTYKTFPTRFWDVFGKNGIPVRTTVSEMGPLLLSRLLNLTQVQEGVLNVVFRVADDKKLLLTDLKDLRSMLEYCAENRNDISAKYGNVSVQSIGAIQRGLLTLENEGATDFFGEPSVSIKDWMCYDNNSRGYINILNATELIHSPKLYAMFMLWLLSSLFETLPELGDPEKPILVFFFDEAHLLFTDMPKELKQKIIQVIKLIRSKGVGVYFISQSPSDIPDDVLSQLGNRIQHGLRAYTPAEQKAVRAAASAFRANPAFKCEDVITQLATGEALVSFLGEDGSPSMVQRAFILPPQSLMGPGDALSVSNAINGDYMYSKYGTAVDGISAYEVLNQLSAANEEIQRQQQEREALEKQAALEEKLAQKEKLQKEKEAEKERLRLEREKEKQSNKIKNEVGRVATSAARTGINTIIRGILKNFIK